MTPSTALSEPVVGFRVWLAIGRRLVALNGVPWAVGDNRAQCQGGISVVHEPPDARCRCGFYALHRPPSPTPGFVVGAVLLWGRLEVHWDGVRASHARPLALSAASRISPPRLQAVAKRHAVPLVPAEHLEHFAAEHGAVVALGGRPISPAVLLERAACTIHARDWDGPVPDAVHSDGALVASLADVIARAPAPDDPDAAGYWMQQALVAAGRRRYGLTAENATDPAAGASLAWERVVRFADLPLEPALARLARSPTVRRSWREQVRLVESAVERLLTAAAVTRDAELADIAAGAHVRINPPGRRERLALLAAGLRPHAAVRAEITYAHRRGTTNAVVRELAREAVASFGGPPASDDLERPRLRQEAAQLVLGDLDDATVLQLLEQPLSSRFVEHALQRLGDRAPEAALALLSGDRAPLALETCARAAGPAAVTHLRRHLANGDEHWHFARSAYLRELVGQETYSNAARAELRSARDPAARVELCALLPVAEAVRECADVLDHAMREITPPNAVERAWNRVSTHPELVAGIPADLLLRGLMGDDMLDNTAVWLIIQRPEIATPHVLARYWHAEMLRTIDLYDLLLAVGERLERERTKAIGANRVPRSGPAARRLAAALAAAPDSPALRAHAARIAADGSAPRHLVCVAERVRDGTLPGDASARRGFVRWLD